jgi:hypothetical protein
VTFATAFLPAGFQNNAFQIAGTPPEPGAALDRADILRWKRRADRLSQAARALDETRDGERAEIARSLRIAYGIAVDEPEAETLADAIRPFAASEAVTPAAAAIDWDRIARDAAAVATFQAVYAALVARLQAEADDEDDAETLLLMGW